MKKKNIVVKKTGLTKQPEQAISPAMLVREAISGKADLEKLEKLLSLLERKEANEARKLFSSAFSVAQTNIGTVIKTQKNPQTHSKYADLSDIIESAKPIYTREGFSVIFYEGDTVKPEHIRICADILHTAGHKESYYYDIPLDGVGIKGNANMTKIHAKASSTSYGRRYLMCMIWNIPTADDDGNGGREIRNSVKKPDLYAPQAKEPEPLEEVPGNEAEMPLEAPKEPEPIPEPEKKKNGKIGQLNAKFAQLKKDLGESDFRFILGTFKIEGTNKKITKLQDIKTFDQAELIIAEMEGAVINKQLEDA